MRQVLNELERLRHRTRLLLLVQRGALLAACVLAGALALVLVDYALRLPSALRLVLLLAALAGLGTALVRYLAAAVSFRPTLTQLALRVERAVPGVAGRLASSVEFAVAGVDRQNPLAARSVREAQRRLSGESVSRILRPARTLRDLGVFLGVALIVAVLVIVSPGTAQTGLARLLLPYGATTWPARTAVASLMHEVLERDGVHPRGEALLLRARNLTEHGAADRVDAYFRTRRDGENGEWQHVVLTHQGDGVHERLVDTNAEAIEVFFATEDARTEGEGIALITPPAIVRATIVVTPPAYAAGRVPPLATDLGPGIDDRAVTEPPSLVGSRVELDLELNKPLPVPAGPSRAGWLSRTLGWEGEDAPPALELAGAGPGDGAADRWRLDWTLEGTRTLTLHLRDEFGLTNRDVIAYRIEAMRDLPPAVTITDPPSDVAVLATARVDLAGEAKDDVAVDSIALAASVQRGGADEIEPLDFAPVRDADAPTVGIAATIDLAAYALAEGDIVLVTATATDDFERDGVRHEPAVSSVRRLRILGELELAARLRRQLSAVRQSAIRIEALQGELQEDVLEAGPQPGVKQAQAQLGDRVASQRDAVETLREELQRNRLEDDQLSDLLQQAGDLLEYAGRAANRAVEALETRGQGAAGSPADAGEPPAGGDPREDGSEPGDDAPRPLTPEDQPIVDAQQDVRDELADLIELLDRDEDTWLVQRQLESLIDEQMQLEQDTSRLAPETIGEALENLTEMQQSEIDRIVQRQRDLRDQARRLIEEMRRRASALDELDPQSASGMRSAADTGEQREVDRDMESAAERAARNQLQSAAAAQQTASASLQRMLEDLAETKRARAQELLRQLASLIESIDRLIVIQENELMALAAAVARDDFTGRDRAMIRLSQNTRSVAAEARAAGQSSRRIARSLDRAADAQGAAVVALRAKPREADGAREAEERALALLQEAKTQAEEVQAQTQEQQVQQAREELIAAYRELAERQIAVRDETLPLAGGAALTRRQLVEARRLGVAQQEIRSGLADVESRTQEVLDSDVFRFVHRLVDRWSEAVSDALREGRADVDVTDRQQMIADSIARQIEALEEALTPPDEFAEEGSGGGGGGGGGGAGGPPPPLIPPVAEVKRLHGLQEQVYDQTRAIDRRDDLSAAQRRQRVRELGQMQRELVTLGEKMLEQLQSGAAPSGGREPAPDPDPDPESREER